MVEGGLNVLGDVDADGARADVVGARLHARSSTAAAPVALVDVLFSVRYAGPELT